MVCLIENFINNKNHYLFVVTAFPTVAISNAIRSCLREGLSGGRVYRHYIMNKEIETLLVPTIKKRMLLNGTIIEIIPEKDIINKMLNRYLYGRILVQNQRGNLYIDYFPGYLHNIPFVRIGKGKIFICELYDLVPILKIISKYLIGNVSTTFVENFLIEPSNYLTGFQRTWQNAKRNQKQNKINWKRGLDNELYKKYSWPADLER